jgi:hypothetical protein
MKVRAETKEFTRSSRDEVLKPSRKANGKRKFLSRVCFAFIATETERRKKESSVLLNLAARHLTMKLFIFTLHLVLRYWVGCAVLCSVVANALVRDAHAVHRGFVHFILFCRSLMNFHLRKEFSPLLDSHKRAKFASH